MRYLSIDFLRGLTIAFMIIVNTPGDWGQVYSPLLHADWHGCTPTDLVFPSFMFIVGVSMWFAFERYGRTWQPGMATKVIRRSVLLVLIGVLATWYPFYDTTLSELRIPGVLVRIGVTYGLASALVLSLSWRGVALTSAGILLGYWALLYFGATPGTDPYGLQDNVVRQFDLQVLGANHIWKGKGIPFDPEGILSTFPAVVTIITGWWSGSMMQKYQLDQRRVAGELLLWGNILALGGMVWDFIFPMNKSLWTSSYVLYTSGLSMIFLAFAVWVIDIKGWRSGTKFFLVLGANALFAYTLSWLLISTMWMIKINDTTGAVTLSKWIVRHLIHPIDSGKLGSLLFALGYLMAIWSICYVLYRKKIWIKI